MIPNHRHFKSIGSTHTYAIENGASLADRAILTADYQSQGRGRSGRTWLSAEGQSLLISIVLKPAIPPLDASLVTPILAVATCELLQKFKLTASIKWPNDVLIRDKKIGGILAEGCLIGSKLSHVVASLGLNIKQDEGELNTIDRPATSILNETNLEPEPQELLEELLTIFFKLYDSFLEQGFTAISDRWRDLMTLVGEEVLIDLGGQVMKGSVEGFGNDGAIEIRDHSNKLHRLHSGEILKLTKPIL
ncbi:MAG: biotin--[acetyl-CoA-carboxylase] ligase [Deltaproteobacteria bacterium]|nr:biotin--[acetyl-CoA-carboxylase] ligase [Deltaproteobacteria bacterium]